MNYKGCSKDQLTTAEKNTTIGIDAQSGYRFAMAAKDAPREYLDVNELYRAHMHSHEANTHRRCSMHIRRRRARRGLLGSSLVVQLN